MPGLERAPVKSFSPDHRLTGREQDSRAVFQLIGQHITWLERYLGIGTPRPFSLDDKALECRRKQLAFSQQATHRERRDVHELALQLGVTIKQMEAEFGRQKVLDIGCGEGRFGSKLSRSAKATVVYLDRNPAVLPQPTRDTRLQVVARLKLCRLGTNHSRKQSARFRL